MVGPEYYRRFGACKKGEFSMNPEFLLGGLLVGVISQFPSKS